jgi:hypothetical protein
MLTLVIVLSLIVGVILAGALLAGGRHHCQAKQRRRIIARQQYMSEQRLHQLTQDAVARMLEAARRR